MGSRQRFDEPKLFSRRARLTRAEERKEIIRVYNDIKKTPKEMRRVRVRVKRDVRAECRYATPIRQRVRAYTLGVGGWW